MKASTQKIRYYFLIVCLVGLGLQSVFSFETKTVFQNEENTREIHGIIIDAISKRPLVFATINVLESNISTITNTEGTFVLKVPTEIRDAKISISYLGYESKVIPLTELGDEFQTISLNVATVDLQEVSLLSLKDASKLVREVFQNRDNNYMREAALMTAFYRESIKKRNRNVSLSEAVVNIYKTSYSSTSKDNIKIHKSRKSTDYKRLDTVAFKLQGGPFNNLFLDIIKYPEYIFADDFMSIYDFELDRSTQINNQVIYVIKFKQKDNIDDTLFKGELFIEPQKKVLVSAIYSLNIKNSKEASRVFVKRKPRNASVYPKEVVYRVDYTESNGKWHYSYGNAMLKFKINDKMKRQRTSKIHLLLNRYTTVKVVLGCSIFLLGMTSCKNEMNNEMKGAWSVKEVHWITPDTTYTIEKAQPGIFMVTDTKYSFIWTPIKEKRKAFVELANPTQEEIIDGFRSIVFNAGSYTKTDTTFHIEADIAKVPGFEGGEQKFEYIIRDDVLHLKMIDETYPNGQKPSWFGSLETKFVLQRID